jgi:multiple sugar transport system ATP-binding protein
VLTARLLGIEHLLDRLPGQLSGGERQRVALGRAIVRRPAAFLLDEPLSQLDAGLRVSMRREIRTLHERQGATTIYVTHDQEEALSMGDRIAVMNAGRVQQIGTGDELLRQPGNRFVAGFIGMPPMNFVPLKLRDGGHQVQLDCGGQSRTWDKPVPWRHWPAGGQVLLGVRPQDLRLAAASLESGWRGKISVVESSGEFNLIHVDLFDVQATWVCRVEPAATYRRGEPVSISWSSDREHWFDAQTGNNLACQC